MGRRKCGAIPPHTKSAAQTNWKKHAPKTCLETAQKLVCKSAYVRGLDGHSQRWKEIGKSK